MNPNPIINMLQPAADPLAGIFNTLKSAKNPITMLQTMAQNDPRLQEVVNVLNQYRGDARQAFYAEAKNKGANITNILQQAQSMMK